VRFEPNAPELMPLLRELELRVLLLLELLKFPVLLLTGLAAPLERPPPSSFLTSTPGSATAPARTSSTSPASTNRSGRVNGSPSGSPASSIPTSLTDWLRT